jgi:hypothetical protein
MARIRSLKPTIWDSEQFADVSFEARLTFIGLITQADDDGRLKGSARRVKGKLFPYDSVTPQDIDGWLTELAENDLIIRFSNAGVEYVELPTWHSHQKINRKTDSALPSHSDDGSSVTHGALSEDSLPEGRGREGSKEGSGEESSVVTADAVLSNLLADLVAQNDPNGKRPTVSKEWAVEEERMYRLDERPREEAERLLRWTMNHHFWKNNILSMPTFRKQYGRLYGVATEESKGKAQEVSPAERRANEIREKREARAAA